MKNLGRKDSPENEIAADDLLTYWDNEYKDSDKNDGKVDLFDGDNGTKRRKTKVKKEPRKGSEEYNSKRDKVRKANKEDKEPLRFSKTTVKMLILLIGIVGVIAGTTLAMNKINEQIESTQEVDKNKDYSHMEKNYSFGKGEYKCGTDFKPGLYYIECDTSASLTEVQIKVGDMLKKTENLGSASGKTGFNYEITQGMIVKCDGYIQMEWLSDK